MSRQKGTRRPPKVEREARLAKYTRRKTERIVEKAERFKDPDAKPRRWAAIGWSTLLLLFGYFSAIGAVFEFDDGNTTNGWAAVATAVVAAALSLIVLGKMSRAPTPVKTGLAVVPGAIAGFVLLVALTRDPGSAIVLSFGVAGALTLRLEPGLHSMWRRIGTVGFFLLATVLFGLISVDGAATVAPLFPYVASGITDVIMERERRRS
ncbi:MAG TPA: hypothetical protein VK960_03320 [Acidimicrobiia bacterium]|nr:hypothetical protein [Acidimicrobiia bacterium]